MVAKFVLLAFVLVASTSAYDLVTRAEWGARSPAGTVSNLSVNPPSHVVIHHAASAHCTTKSACIPMVQSFQDQHIDVNGWSDIGYNFLVGEDGNVYEGRGWGKTGAHAPDFNSKSIGICVIGTYTSKTPNNAAINAIKALIADGVSADKISSTYKLMGHRQGSSTECPGNALYALIQDWPHWTSNP